jgi:hypothetical protein
MTLTLNLPPELEQYLTQQAQQQGLSKAKRNPTLLIIISWWVVLGFTSFYPTYVYNTKTLSLSTNVNQYHN